MLAVEGAGKRINSRIIRVMASRKPLVAAEDGVVVQAM